MTETTASPTTVEEPPYTVVVGVSASSKSPAALAWAQAQAEANRGRVVAVRAWRLPNPQATPSGTSAGRIARAEEVEAEALRRLGQDVADVLGTGHGADLRLVRGGKLTVLLRAAAVAGDFAARRHEAIAALVGWDRQAASELLLQLAFPDDGGPLAQQVRHAAAAA